MSSASPSPAPAGAPPFDTTRTGAAKPASLAALAGSPSSPGPAPTAPAGAPGPAPAGPPGASDPSPAASLPGKLRTLRRKQGLSQQDVAERLGITRQTVSNWEAGQGSPALDRAVQLAALYRVSLDELASTDVTVSSVPSAFPDGNAPHDLHVLRMAAGRACKLGFSDTDLALRIPSDRPVRVTSVDADWLRAEYEPGRSKPTVRELIDVDALVCIDLLDEDGEA